MRDGEMGRDRTSLKIAVISALTPLTPDRYKQDRANFNADSCSFDEFETTRPS